MKLSLKVVFTMLEYPLMWRNVRQISKLITFTQKKLARKKKCIAKPKEENTCHLPPQHGTLKDMKHPNRLRDKNGTKSECFLCGNFVTKSRSLKMNVTYKMLQRTESRFKKRTEENSVDQ